MPLASRARSGGARNATENKYLTLVCQIDLDVTRLLWIGKERTIESFAMPVAPTFAAFPLPGLMR